MFLYLSKLLPLLVYPLGLACILILLALFIRNLKWQKVLLGGAFLVLYLGGNGWVASGLARSLEWRYVPPAETPHAQTIVILAGDERAAHYPRQTPEIGEAGDREIYASHLYHEGAAPFILFSGGAIEWLSADTSPGDTAQRCRQRTSIASSCFCASCFPCGSGAVAASPTTSARLRALCAPSAARRSDRAAETPYQIGGWGFCTGFGSHCAPRSL